MKKNLIILCYSFLPLMLSAQEVVVPQVPSSMQFADIKLKLTEPARKEIQADVDALTASAKFFNAKVDRAAMYMPFVEKIFKEEELPDDFKYLAIQESGFISDAVSTSNAVGFWQFKKLSAQEVGLRVDNKVDERQNIIASSRGAAKYLQKNNFFFNNWLYALQAYQMGAGGAMDALGDVKGGAKTMTIDKKTYWYVKKYLAHKIAFAKAVDEAIAKQSPQRLQVYEDGGGKSLKNIASEINVDYDQLNEFNSWLLTSNIPEDKSYPVIVPTTEASIVLAAANPSKLSEQPVSETSSTLPPERDIVLGEDAIRYITLNGLPGVITNVAMSIDELAELTTVDPNKIISYNDLLPHYQIIEGQIYYLKSKRGKGRIYYHTVQEGESLWMIAQNYGVKESKLMKMNRIEDSSINLKAGRVMWLKKTRAENIAVEYWPDGNGGSN